MTLMKHFLGGVDRSLSERQSKEPSIQSRSFFFNSSAKTTRGKEASDSNRPIYVSSKGYYFH